MNQTESNVYDQLLYYLSHEGEISWDKFKEVVNTIADEQYRYNPSTYLQSLARLGHLDYDPMDLSRVAIAPAVLVDTAVEHRFVLVGSRTPDFIEKVKTCVSGIGGEFSSISGKYAPTTIILRYLKESFLTEIENLGIHVSLTFSAKLAQILPKPQPTSFPKINILLPDSRRKYNLITLEYEPNIQHNRDGFYEIPQHGPSVYILKHGTDQRKVPRDWGEWLALSNAGRTVGFLSYVEKNKTLCVKNPLNLPIIIDRCATLCSGFPPELRGNFYQYSDVPAGVAYKITKSLHQNWEVI